MTIKVIVVNGPKETQNCVFMMWHHHTIPAVYSLNPKMAKMLAGDGLDALLTGRVLRFFDWNVVHLDKDNCIKHKMSSLQSAINALDESDTSVLIAVDGGRGPTLEVKNGAIILAKKTNKKLIPISFQCTNYIHLPTWDRSFFPLPFSTIQVTFKDSVAPRCLYKRDRLDDSYIDEIKERIKIALNS